MNILNQNLINSKFSNLNNNLNKKDTPNNNLKENKSFKEILETQKESNIQFSKHASMRLGNRNLSLSDSQIRRVEQGIEKAKQKGIKDSLVLVDNIALVVNIKNNVVVTAIPNDNEKVYTNIDGAVIV